MLVQDMFEKLDLLLGNKATKRDTTAPRKRVCEEEKSREREQEVGFTVSKQRGSHRVWRISEWTSRDSGLVSVALCPRHTTQLAQGPRASDAFRTIHHCGGDHLVRTVETPSVSERKHHFALTLTSRCCWGQHHCV